MKLKLQLLTLVLYCTTTTPSQTHIRQALCASTGGWGNSRRRRIAGRVRRCISLTQWQTIRPDRSFVPCLDVKKELLKSRGRINKCSDKWCAFSHRTPSTGILPFRHIPYNLWPLLFKIRSLFSDTTMYSMRFVQINFVVTFGRIGAWFPRVGDLWMRRSEAGSVRVNQDPSFAP